MDNSQFHKYNGRNISVYIWEYIRAAEELGLNISYLTPDYEEIEKFIEISDKERTIRIVKAMLPFNNVIAALFAKKKVMTNLLLKRENIPTPKQHVLIDNKIPEDVNYPVVVKPQSLSGGKGITSNINTMEELKKAISYAKEFSEEGEILVEEMLKGGDHRVLVFNGEVIAAIVKRPAIVTGDGESTISQLIDEENNSQQRRNRTISTIKLNNDSLNMINHQGYESYNDVPKSGEEVKIHAVGNLSMGATTENVTDIIHQDFIKIAIKSAKALDLKLAGVDIIAEDISKPASNQSHGVIEVNAHPGSRLHIYPNVGDSVDVAKIILSKTFNLDS